MLGTGPLPQSAAEKEQTVQRLLASEKPDKNGDSPSVSGPGEDTVEGESDDPSEEISGVFTYGAAFRDTEKKVDAVDDLKKVILDENNGKKRIQSIALSSMQELKSTLDAEQKTHAKEEAETHEVPAYEEKTESKSASHSPAVPIVGDGYRFKKFFSTPAPARQPSDGEKVRVTHGRPEKEANQEEVDEEKASEAPNRMQSKSWLRPESPNELGQSSKQLVDPNAIFRSAPILSDLIVDYHVEYGVSHWDFVAELMYEESKWTMLFHRQTLVAFHRSMRSDQYQNKIRRFNPFRLCMRKDTDELDIIPPSTYEPASGDAIRVASGASPGQARPSRLTAHKTAQEAVKDIHFPPSLIPFKRPHIFSKNAESDERIKAGSKEAKERTAREVRRYLTQILENEHVRNLPFTLELLKCSAMSFDKTLGPSVIEGWVTFSRRPPSTGAVEWHNCRTGCVVCACAVLPIKNSRSYRAWIVVKSSFAAFLRRPTDPQPRYIQMFDSGFEILKSYRTTGHEKHIFLHSNTSVADLYFQSRNERKQWANYLQFKTEPTSWQCRDHPNGSYAPERDDRCFAKLLVDGESYFAAVADSLERANTEIFIAGWWITPDIVMKRNASEGYDHWKLSAILKRKAKSGVKVYVLMFREVEVAIALNSKFQESRLSGTPNIYILRHPNFRLRGSWYWSHHEKLVVVDGVYAFTGGLDLCWGRYDNDAHKLLDMGAPAVWPGIDYYNPRVRDIFNPTCHDKDILDRSVDPRMPWHDVACAVSGAVARDLARHFIHQWNFAIESKSGSRSDLPMLVPKDFPVFPEPEPDFTKVKCQVLRSLPVWSGGSKERSIQNGYVAAIAEAQQYIYIENQFFVSGVLGDDVITNRIADALYMRIARAAAEKKPFKVMIFLPLLPAFEGAVDDSGQAALRQVLFWQYRTICRGENRRSLWQMLEDNPDVRDPGEYLAFFGLRTFDKNQVSATTGLHGEGGKSNLLTEIVYIHSKCMIIDDNVAFIGSANINERSMTGERDSEVCLKIMDVTYEENARLAGEPWEFSGSFVHNMRMRLFEEHFGSYLPMEVMDDFVTDENFARLKGLARSNTLLYEKVFALMPSDKILTFADLRQLGNAGERPPQPLFGASPAFEEEEDEEFPIAKSEANLESKGTASSGRLVRLQSFSMLDASADGDGTTMKEKLAYLNGIYGHAVEFPLRFLSRARRLKPAAGVLGDQIFT